MVYTDIIVHDELGAVQAYWDSKGKMLETGIGCPSRLDTVALSGSLEKDMPEIFDYLLNFGRYEKAVFDIGRLDFTGFSEFTTDVYKALYAVPKGALVTYGELAEMAGYPRAARAVGSAMRKNRFLMLIPCHRVVASDSLGGFVSGLETKIRLLRYEDADLSWLKKDYEL